MDIKRIITDLLGLQDVIIEDIKLWKKTLRAEVRVRQKASKTSCNKCGGKLYGVHQWELKKLKAPPLGIFNDVTIKLYQLRAACDNCQAIRLAEAKFIHPKFKSLSCGFAEVAGRLMEETTCEAAARLLKSEGKLLWSLDQWRMSYMLQFMRLPDGLDVTLLSADEVHFHTKRFKERVGKKRYQVKFVTNLVCYSASKVLFNAMGRDSSALKKCFNVLSEGQKMAVQYVAVDMHDPFINVIKEELPKAEICVDRFHLAQHINKQFDKVRRSEIKLAEQNKSKFEVEMLAPSKRFILIEKEKKLTKDEIKKLAKLRNLNENINNSMLIVESFHQILDKKSIKSFRSSLVKWYRLVRESGLEPFKKFCLLLVKYRRYIEAYIKSRLTTAVSEGLNNKIKVLRRMGYGYSNQQSYRHKILQRCGFLNSNYIDTRQFYWHVDRPRK